jgi:hypothetical protein
MNRQTIICWLTLWSAPVVAQERARDLGVEIHGTILFNGFRNSGPVNNSDVPTVALVVPATGVRTSSLSGTARQTRVTLAVRSESVLGGRLSGELDLDFFGGQQPSTGGRTHPLPRIRRAYGELRWSYATVLVGQEAPPIAEVNPSSLASIGLPLFAASGNLWLWIPHLRATGWFTRPGGVRVGIEGALLAPTSGEPQDPFLTQPDRGERSGRPAFEGRVLARWNQGGKPGTVSVGGHYGWFLRPDNELESSRAVAVAVNLPIGNRLEVRGELFRGRALAGLGGGGIGQLTDPTGLVPVRTRGGWGQLVVFPVAALELNLGAGIDDPTDADLVGANARIRNRTFSFGLIGRAAPVLLGFEVRRVTTTYLGPPSTRASNTHLNLAAGVEF